MSYVYKYAMPARGHPSYDVGYYSPDGEWLIESGHKTVVEAAGRVHWLNGGVALDAIEELIDDAIQPLLDPLRHVKVPAEHSGDDLTLGIDTAGPEDDKPALVVREGEKYVVIGDIVDQIVKLVLEGIPGVTELLAKHKLAQIHGADKRPVNCRFRLQDEGKPYPRSSCFSCGAKLATLGSECGLVAGETG